MTHYLVLIFLAIGAATVHMSETNFKPAGVFMILLVTIVAIALLVIGQLWLITAALGFAIAAFIAVLLYINR